MSDSLPSLVNDFIATFNEVEQYLRKETSSPRTVGISQMIRLFKHRHTKWQHADDLHMIAEVRNIVVHEQGHEHAYPALPTQGTMTLLKKILEDLTNPGTAYTAFKKRVVKIDLTNTLSQVLTQTRESRITHFPLYKGNALVGVVTATSLMHWLASHLGELPLLDPNEVTAEDLLSYQENPSMNFKVVSRDTRQDDVVALFSNNALLEAVVITHSGKSDEEPLGIATRWDLVS